MLRLSLLGFIWLTSVTLGLGQRAANQQAGTCRCCELGRIYAPYLKELAAPKKRSHIGNSQIKITTQSAEAQAWFNQGVNLLHAFWEFEAYRCFLHAAKLDPNCAMAYWGICMSLPGKNPESAKERQLALTQAKKLAPNSTPHEQLYVEMVERLINMGSQATLPTLEKIITKHPQDTEALAWYCLWQRDGYEANGKPRPGTAKAEKLLRDALEKHPHHSGLNHYLIHVLEMGPDYEKARQAATALAADGKGSGHLVHMPGHIYYLAGEYEKACAAFRQCHEIETRYLTEEKIPALDNNNYLHNLHFLSYAAADQGAFTEALKAARTLAKTPVPVARQAAVGAPIINYYGPTIEALVHIRMRQFQAAAQSLKPHSEQPQSAASHYIWFLRSYCLIQHQLRSESPDMEVVQREKLALNTHHKNFLIAQPKPSAETQPWSIANITCKILKNETRAWLANIPNKTTFQSTWAGLAIREYARSAYTEPPLLVTPVEESMGWLALQSKHYAKARSYFEASLKIRRKSGHAYLGIARCFRAENNAPQAKIFYQKFLTSFAHADKNLPSIQEATAYLKENN